MFVDATKSYDHSTLLCFVIRNGFFALTYLFTCVFELKKECPNFHGTIYQRLIYFLIISLHLL